MADERKNETGRAMQRDSTPALNLPDHPLLGALKGYVQVMPGTDLTEPADPAWGDGDPKM